MYEYKVQVNKYTNPETTIYAIYRKGHIVQVTSCPAKVAETVKNQRIINFEYKRH